MYFHFKRQSDRAAAGPLWAPLITWTKTLLVNAMDTRLTSDGARDPWSVGRMLSGKLPSVIKRGHNVTPSTRTWCEEALTTTVSTVGTELTLVKSSGFLWWNSTRIFHSCYTQKPDNYIVGQRIIISTIIVSSSWLTSMWFCNECREFSYNFNGVSSIYKVL